MNKSKITGLALGLASMLYLSSAVGTSLYDVKVAKDGSADFTTIQEALAKAPRNNKPYVVFIHNGVYNEKLNITRPNVYLIGEDRDRTVIMATTANGMIDSRNGEKFGILGSRTVNVDAADFRARSLTILNGFDYRTNEEKKDDDPTKIEDTQAVAVLISDKADRAQFKNVRLDSFQNTLYIRNGRTYFDTSRISGAIDFISGAGTALIENSDIIAREHKGSKKGGKSLGYVTAPSTNINTPYGFVFKNCSLSKESGVLGKSYALGRPWHPTTTFEDGRYADPNAIGHAAFINCQMDDHIYGWDRMSGKDINQENIWFKPEDSRFWESKNRGTGALMTKTRPQLSEAAAAEYTIDNILSGWLPDIVLNENSRIKGEVVHPTMKFPASIIIKDSMGHTLTTRTNDQGVYQTSIAKLTMPLLLVADDQTGDSCFSTATKRSVCSTALIVDVKNGDTTTANINPFSDLIVSNLAEKEGFEGALSLAQVSRLPLFSNKAWEDATKQFVKAFKPALRAHGLRESEAWDPVSYSDAYSPVMKDIAMKVIPHHGYNTLTGKIAKTRLTDLAFNPILNLDDISKYQMKNNQLNNVANAINEAKTRLFIVGDSTASHYETDVSPKMGWGQALAEMTSKNNKLMVVNAARAGRSSRDFVNVGGLNNIKPLVKEGDYLLIQFSHNDEKCDTSRSGRGEFDQANLCTYPNTDMGEPQFPKGKEEYSFQHSLEKYIAFAKEHNMQPVLLTALPRAKTDSGALGTPITTNQHVTEQNKANGYLFVGNYTQTIRDTARKNDVPLLDMQTRVINAANVLDEFEWAKWWLAVDTKKYPYYQDRTGSLDKPDTTHLQKVGAEVVAKLVIEEIKANEALAPLASML